MDKSITINCCKMGTVAEEVLYGNGKDNREEMTMDIDKILEMLDWNNDLIMQQEGRQLAENIKCLKIFMQPMDKNYNKNIWENCALILSKKSDELLYPYVYELLEWLQDLNWPGSLIILERLKKYKDYEGLAWAIQECMKVAIATEDINWLVNMKELFSENLLVYMPDSVQSILNTYTLES